MSSTVVLEKSENMAFYAYIHFITGVLGSDLRAKSRKLDISSICDEDM